MNDNLDVHIGTWLKECRSCSGLSQRAAGAVIDTHQTTYSKMETGHIPSRFRDALRLAYAFDALLPELPAWARPLLPCATCGGRPPAGFTCNTCGGGGDA
jgi:DNA-binding XRE family transcriptional regulator